MSDISVIQIVVNVSGGCVQSIEGDALPDGMQIDFIVRDQDNIESGDDDPMPDDYAGAIVYW